MPENFSTTKRVGVLGAGQLGKMLATAAAPWDLNLRMLDPSDPAPSEHLCKEFWKGDFRDKETVLAFGRSCDVLTIEIEQVNVEALELLEADGVVVHPAPRALRIIQDKGLQKQFFVDHDIPTSDFALFEGPDGVKAAGLSFPCVQKTRTEGYDGRGVKILHSEADLEDLLPGACLVEDAVDVDTEIAVIAARSPSGEVKTFDPVEMSFHPTANLVEFLAAPARISDALAAEARELAKRTIEAFDLCGLLAVEMFVVSDGDGGVSSVVAKTIVVNDVNAAPVITGANDLNAIDEDAFAGLRFV